MNIFKKRKEIMPIVSEDFIKKEDVVSCKDCGCLLEKNFANNYANKVTAYGLWGTLSEYYCNKCKKPYNEFTDFGSYKKYHGRIRLNEDGTPYGYVKSKKFDNLEK